MFRIVFAAAALLFAAQPAHAASCGATANRASCVGPNGAAVYNKNTGQVQTARPSNYYSATPGTHVQGYRGSATKAVQPSCAWVNGKKVCN